MNGALGQHLIALAITLAAAGWLVRRAVRPKPAGGACAHCPAAKGLTLRAAKAGSSAAEPKTRI